MKKWKNEKQNKNDEHQRKKEDSNVQCTQWERAKKKRKQKCCSQINRMRCNIFSFKQAYP